MTNLLMFDFDGVLVDSRDFMVEVIISACKSVGCDTINTPVEVLELFSVNVYEGLASHGLSPPERAAVLAAVTAASQSGARSIAPVAGMPAALRRLAAAHPLHIISSNSAAFVRHYLRAHHLEDCFAAILGGDSDDSKTRKIRATVAATAGFNRAFYIGDTAGDILEGREAGIETVAVDWGWHSREKISTAEPDFIVSTPAELERLLGSVGA